MLSPRRATSADMSIETMFELITIGVTIPRVLSYGVITSDLIVYIS